MAFSPISLPIQEILLTNFVTDIATISNANDLILQDKLEDIVNNFEMDLTSLSIGTDNAINYVRAKSFIMQDTGFSFQTGTPVQVIAKLEKNANNESVLTVDRLNVDITAAFDAAVLNTLTINDGATVDGPITINSTIETKSAMIESKETVIVDVTKSGTDAVGRLTLTSTSRKNIFVKLKATSSPTLNPVYSPGSPATISLNGITKVVLYIDFDATNPPAQNTAFTIYIVDLVEEFASSSISAVLNAESIPTVIRGGQNLSTAPVSTVYLHNDLGALTYDIGINCNATNLNPQGSDVLKSASFEKYGHNISLLYILDENNDDRLLINGSVGLEFFIPA
jgi:hypothetical protein